MFFSCKAFHGQSQRQPQFSNPSAASLGVIAVDISAIKFGYTCSWLAAAEHVRT
jgi:hypothetical protein